jgi:hypothetical protein
MPLYIPEPIFELSKKMQRSATRTFGVKPSGKSRATLHQKDLESLRSVVRNGRDILKLYLMKGHAISDRDIEMAKDRLRAYRSLRGMVLDRISANRNNARRGVYRQGNHLVTTANTHLGMISLASKGLDMALNEMYRMIQSMPTRQLNQQAPKPPRGINTRAMRQWAKKTPRRR